MSQAGARQRASTDYTPMTSGSVSRFHNAKPPRNLAKQQRGDKGGVRETLRNPAKPRETCETPRNHLCETAKPLRNLAKRAVIPLYRTISHRGPLVWGIHTTPVQISVQMRLLHYVILKCFGVQLLATTELSLCLSIKLLLPAIAGLPD